MLPYWEFSLGILAGLVIEIAFSLFMSLLQFRSSTARYRVDKVIEATTKISKTAKHNGLRNKLRDEYRYSLGVVVDNLDKVFSESQSFKQNEWPCLIHHKDLKPIGDRWDFFNDYARPVIDDINESSFLGIYSFAYTISKRVRQLSALTELCRCLENTVSKLDAAFQPRQVAQLTEGDKTTLIQPVDNLSDTDKERVECLREEYRHLHKAWQRWFKLSRQITRSTSRSLSK